MAQFQRHFVQELTKPLIVRQCGDLGFSGDNLSDVISVDLYTDGVAYSGGGTCAGACICPDGSTVALTGSVSGKTASVTLKEDCFAIPGQIGIGIRVTSGTIKTTVLKCVYNVDLFATNNPVDPGSRITLDVGDLINRIDAAVESIPASADQLKAAMAPNFSDTTAYPAGAYVWNNGTLYKFTTAHAAGSWAGTDATAVALGNDVADLKSALVRTKYYYVDASELDTNYDFVANGGDTIRIETTDGTKFTVGQIDFRSTGDVRIEVYGLQARNVSFREVTLPGTLKCGHFVLNNGTAQNIRVTNLSLLYNSVIDGLNDKIDYNNNLFIDSLDQGFDALYNAMYTNTLTIQVSTTRLITPVLTVGTGAIITSSYFRIIGFPVNNDGTITYSTTWSRSVTTTTDRVILMVAKPNDATITSDDYDDVFADILIQSSEGNQKLYDKAVISPGSFEKTISQSGTSLTDSTTRVVTRMVYLPANSVVIGKTNYKYSLYYYTSDSMTDYSYNGNWMTGQFTVNVPGYYLILCANMFDGTLTNVTTDDAVTVYVPTEEQIKLLNESLVDVIVWQRRTMNLNGTTFANSTTRIVSPMVRIKSGTKITADTGYKFNVWFYNNSSMSSYASNTGYTTAHTILNDSYCIILFAKTNDDDLSAIAVNDISKHIHFNFSTDVRWIENQVAFLLSFADCATLYKSPELETMSSIESLTVSQLYGLYDALVALDTSRFSREQLSWATAEDGGNDTTLPVFAYTFNARKTSLYDANNNIQLDTPTLLVVCGIHGGTEKSPAISLYYAIQRAIAGTDDSELSDFLSMFNLKIVPCANPWGYNNSSRFNHRGVNLARNFTLYWHESEPGTDGYGGTEPNSEHETRGLVNFINANSNAYALIDYHNCFDYNDIAYTQDYSQDVFYLTSLLARRLTPMWVNKYNLDSAGKLLFRQNTGHVASVSSQAELLKIAHYALLEINAYGENQSSGSHTSANKYNHDCIEMGIEAFVNMIKSFVAYDVANKQQRF